MVLGSLLADALAVNEKLNLGLIGINGNLCNVLCAVDISLAAEVNERIVGKPCLVSVESVLLVLSVHRHQTLVILAVLAALSSCVGAKVEHIPNVRCPDILAGKELLDELLVIICLIFLGVVALLGVACVPVESLTAVLGNTDRDRGVCFVELIEPRTVHGRIAAVPAEIVVVGNNVGDEQVRIVHLAHGNSRDSGKTCLIHLVNEIV